MKTLKFFLLFLLAQFLGTTTFAQTDFSGFMTPRDVLRHDAGSNINLHNNRNAAVTVYGLYVRQFAYVAAGGTCAQAAQSYSATQNTTAGSVVTPISINAGKSAAVGSNYLYNMIFTMLYYTSVNAFPQQCQLPGCTWGTDSAIYNWCIYLGALTPVMTSAGYTSNVPPAAEVASSGGSYDYNLVTNFVTLGPISCNDRTLTCTVASQQTQSFS